jgi:transcriptional regulator with GAF, ATPase, and Fis domain
VSLFESELFGHAKGAFTGAAGRRLGRVEMADDGTVFLDEIGELDKSLQAKLLNVLQDKVFQRVGDSRPIKADFRVISATNKDMHVCIADGSFRSDLYYRLNTFAIHVPPLRERIEDIPVLAEKLTDAQSRKTHRPPAIFTDSCLEAMCRYPWPGNVRELKNLIKRLVIMRSGEVITAGDFANITSSTRPGPIPEHPTLAEAERMHILQALNLTAGIVGGPKGAAVLLGIPRQTLQYKMRKHGIVNAAGVKQTD